MNRTHSRYPTGAAASRLKPLLVLFAVAFLFTLGHRDAHAQVSLGLQGSYNLDAPSAQGMAEGAFGLGAQARLALPGLPVVLNPGVDYYFTGLDGATVYQFDANVLYPIGVENALFTPYAGLGLALTRGSFEAGTPAGELLTDAGTDFGVNLLGGATFGSGALRPYAQARITFGNHLAYPNEGGEKGPGYALIGGLLFRLGR